MINMS